MQNPKRIHKEHVCFRDSRANNSHMLIIRSRLVAPRDTSIDRELRAHNVKSRCQWARVYDMPVAG